MLLNPLLQPYNEALKKLASTSNGLGASLVGVEDSAGNFTGTNVETVLAELASSGGSTLVKSAESMAGASWIVTGLSGYKKIEIQFEGVSPNTNNVQLSLEVGISGPTWRKTGYAGYATHIDDAGNLVIGSMKGGLIYTTGYAGTNFENFDASHVISGTITIYNLGTAAIKTAAHWEIYGTCDVTAGTAKFLSQGAARYDTAEAGDGIRVLFSSGNIDAGVGSIIGFA